VRVANRVFRPSDEEVEWARSVLAAREARPGDAVFSHRGALVDRPVIERANQIVALADAVTRQS
jgi:citrate lyase beta subunit